MSDVIRKAVELANGWKIHIHSDVDENVDPFETVIIWSAGVGSHKLSDPGQNILDALAAQLVRQVEKEGFSVWQLSGDVTIQDMSRHTIEQAVGPDRTMNTIKAIVDSGILEPPVKE